MNLSTSFRYLAPAARLHVGPGALDQLPAEVRRVGARRAFIVASRTVSRETGLVRRVRDVLGELYAGSFEEAVRESPLRSVMAGVREVQAAGPDLIVAVGGGSAIVTARAISIIAGEGKTVHQMYTRHFPDKPPIVYRANAPKLPNILVPTTPTTGADRGGAAVYDEAPPHRKELYDPKTRPLAILVDPEALLTAPAALYLDTSLTTFCGIVDALQYTGHPALAFADYRQGLQMCLEYLPRLVADPSGAEVRIQLCMAGVLANRASQSTYNLAGMARTTSLDRTIRYRYPHVGQGAANAVLLATSLRMNAGILSEGQTQLASMLGATDAPGCLEAFLRRVGVAVRLQDLGIPRADFRLLAEIEAGSPAFGQGANRVSDVEELVWLLESAW